MLENGESPFLETVIPNGYVDSNSQFGIGGQLQPNNRRSEVLVLQPRSTAGLSEPKCPFIVAVGFGRNTSDKTSYRYPLDYHASSFGVD
jgi:hypothetical protein